MDAQTISADTFSIITLWSNADWVVKGVMVGIGYSAASTAAIYLLMLLVLLFRPRGLFGERMTRLEQ